MNTYDFGGKKVAILGWGINGIDAFRYLIKNGAEITILDAKKYSELDFAGFDESKFKLILGSSYLINGLKQYDYIIRAPGVYRYLPEIVEAEKAGVLITSVANIFFDLCPCKIIGVTGTKGKGTTSSLIYEILEKDGKDVYLAGNIGYPILDLLPKLKKTSWVVLELSSFQLIDIVKSPHIAVVLNVTLDHMDWHKDRDEYVKSKINIVNFQKKQDFAVLNSDYKILKDFSKYTNAIVKYFSIKEEVEGVYVEDDDIIIKIRQKKYRVGSVKSLLLRGKHNWENVCAAVCASYLAGAKIKAISNKVFSFKGLEHRLELVREIRGIKFYNDSFSTNPQTTIAAVNSFEEPLTLILGGSYKGLNYDEMGRVISKRKNIVNVILIGELAEVIMQSIVKSKYKGNILVFGSNDMKTLVKKCKEITPISGVVLLSPAAASFDMFKDYKDRGRQFKEAVKSLM